MMMEDIEKVLFTPEQIAEKVSAMGEQISADYEGKEILMVGILKGASVFMMDLVRSIRLPVAFDFMIVSSYGAGTDSSGQVKIKKDMDIDIRGRHVIVCEDIIDSGITMNRLMAILRDRQPASLALCSLLSKPSRRVAEIKIDYCGWEVPDEFIVGYGLDYAERYRNIPVIGVLKRSVYS
jgi:hypoxanthine phosphoribosyltransferase